MVLVCEREREKWHDAPQAQCRNALSASNCLNSSISESADHAEQPRRLGLSLHLNHVCSSLTADHASTLADFLMFLPNTHGDSGSGNALKAAFVQRRV